MRSDDALLLDMLIAVRKIQRFSSGMSERGFRADERTQSAIIREFLTRTRPWTRAWCSVGTWIVPCCTTVSNSIWLIITPSRPGPAGCQWQYHE